MSRTPYESYPHCYKLKISERWLTCEHLTLVVGKLLYVDVKSNHLNQSNVLIDITDKTNSNFLEGNRYMA